MQLDFRDAPPSDFIEAMRTRYDVEPDVDKVLTRRMERRSETHPSYLSIGSLTQHLTQMLEATLDAPFTISGSRWLSGGASKMQMRFSLDWTDPATGRRTDELVLRMEPTESLNPSSRQREFELLRAIGASVPVPQVFWVDADGTWFPEPTLIYAFSQGITKPPQKARMVTGIGTYYPPEYRKALGPQFVENLARIHRFPVTAEALPSFDVPEANSTEGALWQVNRGRRIWEEDRSEDIPLMDVAANWLTRNVPEVDTPSLVHGDYRAGNFLFDPDTKAFTAVLDWERSYVGDRHRDLAWTSSRILGMMDEDDREFLICGLVPQDEFFERYQEASGFSVDPDRMKWYQVLARYQQVQTTLGTAYRVVRLSKSHQNIVVARLESVAYMLAEELRRSLAEVC
ncbi:MAG: phosphotransferase family protein [Pseudomonadota bacterium]|nr:phosphotransferase family protein [Pseudomonadota bacterium]